MQTAAALTPELMNTVRKAQIYEETGAVLYAYMAEREKNPENRRLLEQMARDEAMHAAVWKNVTREELRPKRVMIVWRKLLTVVMGFTFVVNVCKGTSSSPSKATAGCGSGLHRPPRCLRMSAAMKKRCTVCWTRSGCTMWARWCWGLTTRWWS